MVAGRKAATVYYATLAAALHTPAVFVCPVPNVNSKTDKKLISR